MVTETLLQIGLLTKNETKVYYLLLEFEELPTSILAKKCDMKKGSVLHVGDALQQKGLITKTIKNNIAYYRSEPPEKLISYLERKHEEAQEKFTQDVYAVKKLLPFLENLYTKPSQVLQSKVFYYEGLENVLQSYLTFLENTPENEVIYSYVSPAPKSDKRFQKLLQKAIAKRLEKNIHCKMITTFCEESACLKLTDRQQNRETLIGCKNLGATSETMLSQNQTFEAAYSTAGMVSMLTTNTSNASRQIAFFKLAWRQAKIEDQKNCKLPEFQEWLKKNENLKTY